MTKTNNPQIKEKPLQFLSLEHHGLVYFLKLEG